MNTSPVFLIGCPRSGKTLLGAILNKHPDVLIFFETNIFSVVFRLWNKHCDEKEEESISNCLQSILLESFGSYHKKLGLPEEHIWEKPPGSKDRRGHLFDEYIRYLMSKAKPSAKIWGEKTPNHIGYIRQILQEYPKARFIYSSRDPRDIVNAMSEPSYTPATQSKLQNAYIVKRYLSIYNANRWIIPPEQLLEIRYEDLVINPEGIVEEMCSFLEIGYSPSLLQPANQEIRDFVGWPNSRAWDKVSQQPQKSVNLAIESYLAEWTTKQNYEINPIPNKLYWLARAQLALLPFHMLFMIYTWFWRRKYPDSPFLVLKLPYLQ